MLGDSIGSFGHLERLNPSIIDAMGHCSRIRKNVIENREQTDREQTEKRETNYRGHSNRLWIAGLSGPIILIRSSKSKLEICQLVANCVGVPYFTIPRIDTCCIV